jgi:HlyD family secretion protein
MGNAAPNMAAYTSRKRLILWGGVGLAVVLVAILALRRQPPIVTVAAVTRQDLSANITSNGKVEPVGASIARAEFPTFVAKVMATEGQAVKRGQTILTLDASDVEAQLAQARASLLAAETDLRNAKTGGPPDEVAQLDRDLASEKIEVTSLEGSEAALKDLVAKQAATQQELAQTETSLAKARANLASLEARQQGLAQRARETAQSAGLRISEAQSNIESLAEKVRSARVVAPLDGTLYSLPVHQGDYVKVGDTLAEMADLSHVRVRAFVDEPDLGSLQTGEDVEVTWDAKPGAIWKGRVEQTPKQVVQRGVRSVGEVLSEIDNAKLELLPNINVQVKILVRERHDALVVPREAIQDQDEKRMVYVLVGDTLHRREVSLGAASASKYEVLSGLSQGEKVALPGERTLKDGMEIRPQEED